jgi:hypothetical protein
MIWRAAFWAALGLAGAAAYGAPKDVTPAEPPPRLAEAVPAPADRAGQVRLPAG